MGTKFSTVTSLTSSFNTITQQQQGAQQQGAQQQTQPQQEQNEQKEILFYSQYLSNAKRQVSATNQLRDMLTQFADGLGKDDGS